MLCIGALTFVRSVGDHADATTREAAGSRLMSEGAHVIEAMREIANAQRS